MQRVVVMNSAIEALCDFVETRHNEKIGIIKDIAAAGVGICDVCLAAGTRVRGGRNAAWPDLKEIIQCSGLFSDSLRWLLGAELLVRGASKLALSFGISPLVVGLTVVAFGTSAPEMAVSVQSAWSGQVDIALGNVVGSNIFNVLFILGVSALIVPLVVHQQIDPPGSAGDDRRVAAAVGAGRRRRHQPLGGPAAGEC